MDAVGELVGKQGINGPLPVDARHTIEGIGDNAYMEVRFTAGPAAGMAGMQRRLIDDLDIHRREGLFDLAVQYGLNGFAHGMPC